MDQDYNPDGKQQLGSHFNISQQGQIRTRQSAKADLHPQETPLPKRQCSDINSPSTVYIKSQQQLSSHEQFQSSVALILSATQNPPKTTKQDIHIWYEIYAASFQCGGMVQTSSVGDFPKIAQSVLEKFQIVMSDQQIEWIRQLLFSHQFLKRHADLQAKMYHLGTVNFIDKYTLRSNCNNVWKCVHEYLGYDLTLFQEGAEGLDFNKYIFNLEHMTDIYRNEMIDIRIQNPCDYGFKPHKLVNKSYRMSLTDYRFYQQNYLHAENMQHFRHSGVLEKGQIFFGVNFEPSDSQLNEKIRQHVAGTFLDFHSQFDLLSYLDHDVPGCSLPQMYFKTRGCWTGGHQENICMSALNINHGPDSSEWYTLDLCYVEQLRGELKQKFNMDLYMSEGLWFEKLDWFIRNGYPVKRFLQRKDDIVITGPGTLHWVRSFGVALQTSWNLMPKTYEQLKAAFHRHKMNSQIGFQKSDTIPLKSLITKYLNHERTSMPKDNRQLCASQLSKWLQQQETLLQSLTIKINERIIYYLKDLQSFCVVCKQEVLNYYVAAPKERKRGVSCLKCLKATLNDEQKVYTLYSKFPIYFLEQLTVLSSNSHINAKYPHEIAQLCKGVHVGTIADCEVKNSSQLSTVYFQFKSDKQVERESRKIYFEHNFLFQFDQSIHSSNKDILSGGKEDKYLHRFVSMECQTDHIRFKVLNSDSQDGCNKSRNKKKSKHKSKHKKHKKEKQNSPEFSISDREEEKKIQSLYPEEGDKWIAKNRALQSELNKGDQFGKSDRVNFGSKNNDNFGNKNSNDFGSRQKAGFDHRNHNNFDNRNKGDFISKNNDDFRNRNKDDFGSRNKDDFGSRNKDDFGNRNKDDFGSRNKDDFGSRNKDDFGNRNKDDFGSRNKDDFGSRNKDDFGSRNKDDFGSRNKDDFGSRNKDDFGSRNKDDFGSRNKDNFGSRNKDDFGSRNKDDFGSRNKDNFGSRNNDNFGSRNKDDFGSRNKDDLGSRNKDDFGSRNKDDFGSRNKDDFGSRNKDDFGSRNKDNFGSRNNDNFGSRNKDDFGSRNKDDLGSRNKDDFGSRNKDDFGSRNKDDFGSRNKDDFGSRNKDDFGSRNKDNFGSRNKDDFGSRNNDRLVQKSRYSNSLNDRRDLQYREPSAYEPDQY